MCTVAIVLILKRIMTFSSQRGCLYEISVWVKQNVFNWVPGQYLITVSWKYPEMKLIAGVISLRSF